MTRTSPIILVGALALLVALAVPSCLFSTRDPQKPGKVTGACTLESPSKWAVCLKAAMDSQQDADYERTLSESFLFSPTTADSLDQNFTGTCVYDKWDKSAELQVVGDLFAQSSKTVVDFGNLQVLINKNTFVRYRSAYTLAVIKVSPPDTTTYKGVAQIDVRNEGGNWRVTFWNEIETVPGFSTWGFLRGILGLSHRGSCT